MVQRSSHDGLRISLISVIFHNGFRLDNFLICLSLSWIQKAGGSGVQDRPCCCEFPWASFGISIRTLPNVTLGVHYGVIPVHQLDPCFEVPNTNVCATQRMFPFPTSRARGIC